MATVYFGRLGGPAGFSRIVALKRLHPQFAKDPNLAAGLLDEARVASRIRHPNVVQVVDVVSADGELVLVLDYVHGESLAKLLRAAKKVSHPPPPAVVSAIISDVLRGLHAAHEAKSETGQPLELVHRDISPQNILVHEDGMALVTDFGIARAVGRLQITTDDQLKGKPGYMAPEQVLGETMTRRTDVFAAGIVLWEMCTGHRLFHADNNLALMRKLLDCRVDPPSRIRPRIPPAVDAVVLRALERIPERRFATAKEMLEALERVLPPAHPAAVAEWVRPISHDSLAKRAALVQQIEAEPMEMPLDIPVSPMQTPLPYHQPMPGGSSPSYSPAAHASTTLNQNAHSASFPAIQPHSEPMAARTSPAMVLSTPNASKPRNALLLPVVFFVGAIVTVMFVGLWVWIRPITTPIEKSTPATIAPLSNSTAQSVISPVVPIRVEPQLASPESSSISPLPTVTNSGELTTNKTRPTTRVPSTSNTCNPPYYMDARGIKVFKKQCLGAH